MLIYSRSMYFLVVIPIITISNGHESVDEDESCSDDVANIDISSDDDESSDDN